MKLIQFINLGGPINWILAVMLCFCCCQIFERLFYFGQTFHNTKKFYLSRMLRKIDDVKKFPFSEKKKELQKEVTLIYYEMNRGLWLLNFISAVAPSLGLLGTVTGLIGAFQGLAGSGSQVNIQDLSGGIWEAMLTTAFGMVISIPSLFFYRTFKRIIEKRTMRLGLLVDEELAESETSGEAKNA
ncbi:MotA/TolQ/ExbB proton channel family protein [Treponema sp.]|uniref:MotA/TolQ/ExbB proton channel family protein n=1 Tax=Treponema sp. TaxID=166 RepID=UPI00257E7C33|nr:MotA/TolQ/ExbB proton channel family protein [Treponema sp.]MBE6354224.1 MotA/TolQ/ExbB proton channel family protein [Treponema sp.]